jgi:nitrite reductase/ring-hydroxylating ferredoxin subunit
MDLGPESAFNKFPVLIELEAESFYLARGKKGYLLLSTECPHSGGRVSDQGTVFMCPNHGWRFEHAQGECSNGPNARMISFPVTVREGHLIADVT